MGRFWTLFFALIPVLGTAVFLLAPGWGLWLPPSHASVEGAWADHLFYLILFLTGAVFLATQSCLCWFIWRYDAATGRPVQYTHGNNRLEVFWTGATTLVLLFLVFYQDQFEVFGFTWRGLASPARAQVIAPPLEVEVTGRQFEWLIKYPGKDGVFNTPDDVHHLNDLHVPIDRPVLVHLRSQDVLHSFYLPAQRVKQDAVPGMTIPVRFTPTLAGGFDLVCAELCGWGHYKMKGRLTVQSAADFDQWLASVWTAQEAVR